MDIYSALWCKTYSNSYIEITKVSEAQSLERKVSNTKVHESKPGQEQIVQPKKFCLKGPPWESLSFLN